MRTTRFSPLGSLLAANQLRTARGLARVSLTTTFTAAGLWPCLRRSAWAIASMKSKPLAVGLRGIEDSWETAQQDAAES